MFDLQYGFGSYTSCLHNSLQETLDDFSRQYSQQHNLNEDEIEISEQLEVGWDEVQEASPSNQTNLPDQTHTEAQGEESQ